jgi:hypothetical protein
LFIGLATIALRVPRPRTRRSESGPAAANSVIGSATVRAGMLCLSALPKIAAVCGHGAADEHLPFITHVTESGS